MLLKYSGSCAITYTLMLVVIAGFSGTGKTYLAKKLSEYLNCPHLNSDKVRKNIARIDTTSHIYERFGKGLYSPKMTEKTYSFLLGKAKKLLEKEKFVIVDATFISKEMQRKLLNLGVDYIFFWCTSSDEVVKERLERRENDPHNISDATWEIYKKQKESFEGFEIPSHKIVKIDTSKKGAFEKIVERLRNV